MSRTRSSLVASLAVTGIAGAMLVSASPALAISLAITPANQTVAANTAAIWGGSWGGKAPYKVTFCYGNGTCTGPTTTNSTSAGYSHAFNPCRSTTYTQTLKVTDAAGSSATATAHTLVGNGTSC